MCIRDRIENNSQRLTCYDNLFSTAHETKPSKDEATQEPSQQSSRIVPETFGLKERINQKELPQIEPPSNPFQNLTMIGSALILIMGKLGEVLNPSEGLG